MVTVGSGGSEMKDTFVGCLVGGAVGDALGAPVEFEGLASIRRRFGEPGVEGYVAGHWPPGSITDDTQMTLFTAEGLIRARNRGIDRGIVNVDAVVHRAYERWLFTQVGDPAAVPWDPDLGSGADSGWLVKHRFLHAQRAPGTTCLAALSNRYRLGTPTEALNDRKGCGGVMRVAPVGLVAADPFDLGCRVAALTHGHPSGWLAAGAFAQLVHLVAQGDAMGAAAQEVHSTCRRLKQGAEVATAMARALDLAQAASNPTPESIESLGAGWVAEEALAIALYCALTAGTFREGVLSAVNHSGDSDSTGSMTGNLLGARLGAQAIDADLLDGLEGRPVIERTASDLFDAFVGNGEPDWDRYPPW